MKSFYRITPQVVMSEPSKILVGTKIVGKNQQVKNVYKLNPNSKPVKTIFHKVA